MDGFRAHEPVELAWKRRLRAKMGFGDLRLKAIGGILGRQEPDKLALRVLESLGDGMDTIKTLDFFTRLRGLLVIGHGRPYIQSPLSLNPCKNSLFCG